MPSRKRASDSLPGLPRLDRGSVQLPRLPGLAGPRSSAVQIRVAPEFKAADVGRRAWETPPLDWDGSKAEWAIYWAHKYAVPVRGEEGGDWVFQGLLFGQFLPAGFVPDFIEYDLKVTIDIDEGEVEPGIERFRATILRALRPPYTHVIIDMDDALNNPIFYLNEALAGRSYSVIGTLD